MLFRPCAATLLVSVVLVQGRTIPSVASFLSNTPYLQTFSGLLRTAIPLLSNATVFAPTDESFQGLEDVLSKLRRDDYRLHARHFVEYHIVKGRVKVSAQSEIITAALENITLSGGQSNARVVSARNQESIVLHENMEQMDGIVHTINKPLIPFWFDYNLSNVVDQLNLQLGNQFTVFQHLMETAGIRSVPPHSTLLLPVNQAIPSNFQERLLDPQNSALLAKVVQFHVVPKIINSENAMSISGSSGHSSEKTLEGSEMLIRATDFGLSFGGANASNYVLVQDGIVYPVNKLLFPTFLADPAASTTTLARDEEPTSTLFLDLLQLSSVGDRPSIFVPIGSAFQEDLEGSYLSLLRDEEDYQLHMTGLMSYHTTSTPITQMGTTAAQESMPMTLGGTVQVFRSDGSLFLDSPNNPPSKVLADDGTFAVIDRPLLPSWTTWSPLAYMNDFELSFPLSRYRYFLELIVAANMESMFTPTGDDKLTVLAPENDAISWGHRFFFLYMPDNVLALRELLRYHVVPELVNFQKIGASLPTLLGSQSLSISKEGGYLKLDEAKALSYSLTGKHSILYRISGVLVPPTIKLPPWVDSNSYNESTKSNPVMTRTIFQDIPVTVE